jgi:hypothetical protein
MLDKSCRSGILSASTRDAGNPRLRVAEYRVVLACKTITDHIVREMALLGARSCIVPNTVLEAIKMGLWDFEPKDVEVENFEACGAMPGTSAKLLILAERVRLGLPLWHPADRQDAEEVST